MNDCTLKSKTLTKSINLFVFCIRAAKYYVQIITRYHKFTSIMRFNFGLIFDIYVEIVVLAADAGGAHGLNQFNFMVCIYC